MQFQYPENATEEFLAGVVPVDHGIPEAFLAEWIEYTREDD